MMGDMSDVLAGHLLVAAPTLIDPNFADSVVLLLDVDGDGALGVVLNRPTALPISEVLAGWGDLVAAPEVLYRGGPVSTEGALAIGWLVDPEDEPVGWRGVFDDLGIVDLDTPVELVSGSVSALRIYAGYAGWGAGQLEAEIEEGSWYVVPSEPGDMFRSEAEDLRRDVLKRQPGELAWYSTRPIDPELN